MRLLSVILLSAISSSAIAAIIPVLDQRRITYQNYFPKQYYETTPSSPFAYFDERTNASSQISGLTSNSLYGYGSGLQAGPYLDTGHRGSSFFDMAFEVDSDQYYDLTGTISYEFQGIGSVSVNSIDKKGLGLNTLIYYVEINGSQSSLQYDSLNFSNIFHFTSDNLYILKATGASNNFDGAGYYDFQLQAVTVPVPAAAWLFGSGLLVLSGFKRKKQLNTKSKSTS